MQLPAGLDATDARAVDILVLAAEQQVGGLVGEHYHVNDRVLKRGERHLLALGDTRLDANLAVARTLRQQIRVAAEAEAVGGGGGAKSGPRRCGQQRTGRERIAVLRVPGLVIAESRVMRQA